MSGPQAHCRLCAEPSPRLVGVDDEVGVNCDLKHKMLLVNVDVSAPSPLPRSVCFPCLSLLVKTAMFLSQVRAAQDKLSEIYPENKVLLKGNENGARDFEISVKKEHQVVEQVEIKIEICPDYLFEEVGLENTEPLDVTEEKNKTEKISLPRRQSHTTDADPTAHTCHICEKVFQTKNSLNEHLKRHDNNKPYTCATCGKGFIYQSRLQAHLSVHSTDKPFSCEECGKTFRLKSVLTAHKDTHSELRASLKRKYVCGECGKAWKSKFQLEKHQKIHTERTRDYSCHVCGKAFWDEGTLQGHMVIHKTTKYKCDVCGKGFYVASKLKLHALQHSSERPFPCDQCSLTYRHKQQLKRHSRTHSDLRPHVCSYCNKAFKLRQTLIVHLRLHTGARPFSCEFCGKGFYNHSNHYKHVRKVHGADPRKKKEADEERDDSAIGDDKSSENQ